MTLQDFTTLTFDIIGTLIDFETGVITWMKPRLQEVRPDISDEDILQAHARAEVEHHDSGAAIQGNKTQLAFYVVMK